MRISMINMFKSSFLFFSEMKMNNQEIERFEHHVTDMYNILINISTELNTIKVIC